MEDEDFFTTGPTAGDLWSSWSSGDELYQQGYIAGYDPEYLYGTPTEFSVGPDQYDTDDEVAPYVAADRFSFMATDDEGEFYDPEEPNVYPPGTAVVNLEDFRSGSGDFDDVTNYSNQLARIASTIISSNTMNPIFGGARNQRERDRFRAAQPGDIPRGVGQSNLGATQTRFDGIQRRNSRTVYGEISRTGIDVRPIVLTNIPKPNRVTIPSPPIKTTSGARRTYARTATA